MNKSTKTTNLTSKLQGDERKFQQSWCTDRPWLQHDNQIMWCSYCREHKVDIKTLMVSDKWITGVSAFKKYKVTTHEDSHAHKRAAEIHRNTIDEADKAPAMQITSKLDQSSRNKLLNLFRNVHSLVRHYKGIDDFIWMCQLDVVKGVDIGTSYRTNMAAARFVNAIATLELSTVAKILKEVPFFAITCDGSTDTSSIEQEITFVNFCSKGHIETKFVGLGSPDRANATGISKCIKDCFKSLDETFDEDFFKEKLVAIGCDGAAVMLGKRGSVVEQFRQTQPSLVSVHCYVHR